MSPRSRLTAAAAFAQLALAACSPRESYVGASMDDGGSTSSTDGAAVDAPPADASPEVAAADAGRPDLGPPCVLGGTTALLPATIGCPQAAPGRIVVTDRYAYWSVDGPGAIVLRAPLTTGVGEPLVYDEGGALGLAVDDTFVYYTQPTLGRVMRLPLAGGAPTPLVTKLDAPKFLASDGASLYWTGGRLNNGSVLKLALADGARPETLLDGQSGPFAIALDGAYVYWTDIGDGSIVRALAHPPGDADGGVRTASRLASGLKGPTDLVLAGGYAYAPDQLGFVRRVPLAGGALETVADAHGRPYGLATDGATLYWSTSGAAGAIFAAPLGASVTGRALVEDQADPGCLAVAPGELYWATQRGQPTVRRLARF